MAHSAAVTKAVIPVAGLGTRFLPATKATPKVMMPVVDKPAIQYVVEEAAAAGLQDVLLVTGDGQESIADHFSRARELERQLEAKGNVKALAAVRAPTELADVSYVRQHQPRGLGHAVACAADHVGNEPFAVLLGDDLISADEALLDKMIGVRKLHGGSVVALMEVPADQISAYGVAAFKPTDDPDIVAVTDLVEKPGTSEAPSNWIVIGRYVCDPAIFSSPTRCGRSPSPTGTCAQTAAACTACCSAAAGSTPATYKTSCGPRSSSPAPGQTWPAISYPGSASTSAR